MFKTVRHDTKRKSLNLRPGLIGGATISEDAREVNDFGNPATVFLLFNFHSKLHTKWILRLSAAVEKDRNDSHLTPEFTGPAPAASKFMAKSNHEKRAIAGSG